MSNKKGVTILIFFAMDTLLILCIFLISFFIRDLFKPLLQSPISWSNAIRASLLGLVFTLITFSFMGVFPGYGLTAPKELELTTKALILKMLVFASLSFLYRPFQIYSRSLFLVAGFLSLIVLPISHFALRNIISKSKIYGEPVTLFGDQSSTSRLFELIKKNRRMGWQVTQILPLSSIHTFNQKDKHNNKAIVITDSPKGMKNTIRELSKFFHTVILVRDFDNFGSLWIYPRDISGKLGLEFKYNLLKKFPTFFRNIVDRTVAVLLVFLLLPVFIIIGIIIKIDSRGPIIYRQVRLGKNYSEFKLYKYRTMKVNAETHLTELLNSNEEIRHEYSQYHKLKNDPRITRVGKWLRKFSLDELPQLFNVIKGDMQLIGPRAYMTKELKDMGNYASLILRLKPGLTGYWQVVGRNNNSFNKRLELDEYYISNWSIWLDYYILLKTFSVIIAGTGS